MNSEIVQSLAPVLVGPHLQPTLADPRQTMVEAIVARGREILDAGLRIEVLPDGRPFMFDPALLREALEEVLARAIQSSRPGAALRCASRDDCGQTVLVVEDEGHPTLPALRAAESSDTSVRGLGLQRANAILEAHGGHIEAFRTGLRGTRVEMRIPHWDSGFRPWTPGIPA